MTENLPVLVRITHSDRNFPSGVLGVTRLLFFQTSKIRRLWWRIFRRLNRHHSTKRPTTCLVRMLTGIILGLHPRRWPFHRLFRATSAFQHHPAHGDVSFLLQCWASKPPLFQEVGFRSDGRSFLLFLVFFWENTMQG